MQEYNPPAAILDKYADVLVRYALNSGKGIKQGEVVMAYVPDIAKPLGLAIQGKILEAGGHPMVRLIPTGGFERNFYEHASEEQIKFFPKDYLFERVNLIDHQIVVIGEPDPDELKGIDPRKLMLARDSKKEYRDRLVEKENKGKFTWTIALWGTQAKADLVGLSLEDYWQQIIDACFLDQDDPIAKWSEVTDLQDEIKQKLNDMKIEYLHLEGEDMDITYKLGADRIWAGGSGRNIPSFELFTSPDWRGTNGWIKFNQPLYRYGNILEGIRLEFNDGIVTNATATKGEDVLKEMVKGNNADKVGEISLTDNRMSRITHVMAETLYDENIGGEFGNHHLAVGRSYHDCFRGDPAKPTEKQWEEMGFNDSAEHTDIITTTDRTATATLPSGEKLVIYEKGQFVI